jgi:putative tricarboxylic transport membrane protein
MGAEIMTDQSSAGTNAPLFGFIRSPQSFFGGLILIGIALFAFWASSDLTGLHSFSFGPGTAPRLFAGLLLAFGVVIVGLGLLFDGPAMEPLP